MDDRRKKVLLVGGAATLAAIGIGVLWTSSAKASSLKGEPYVIAMIKMYGYETVVTTAPDMPVIQPDVTSKSGPKIIDWIDAEQRKGRTVVIPSGYYQGTMNVSPSQIMSVDAALGPVFEASGVFKVCKPVAGYMTKKSSDSTGAESASAAGAAPFDWTRFLIGTAGAAAITYGAVKLVKPEPSYALSSRAYPALPYRR